MNIIEAMASGKNFKRARDKEWSTGSNLSATRYLCELTYDDILANDWEIQKQKQKIKLYKWAYFDEEERIWREVLIYYENIVTANRALFGGASRHMIRLDYSMIEVEE